MFSFPLIEVSAEAWILESLSLNSIPFLMELLYPELFYKQRCDSIICSIGLLNTDIGILSVRGTYYPKTLYEKREVPSCYYCSYCCVKMRVPPRLLSSQPLGDITQCVKGRVKKTEESVTFSALGGGGAGGRRSHSLGNFFDRPGVAGAVLQTASLLTYSVSLFLKYLHNIINQKR